jgi:hypothetical protein
MAKGDLMQIKLKILFSTMLIAGFGVLLLSPLLTTPVNAQVYYNTPTASANGNIYYTVREGETCESIALLNSVDIAVLRELNSLGLNDCTTLQVGEQLVLGVVPTAVITAGPSPTPTNSLPTPEPVKGYGKICVYLYNDLNGDAMADVNETTDTGLAGGEISINNADGSFSQIGTTIDTGAPVCFEDVPEGDYTITIAIPDGYNPTASQNYALNLKAGDTATVNFSAQASSSLIVNTTEGNSSVFVAVIGGLILVAGLGLGVYAKLINKKK